ncbi:MAG: hypothetical protein AMK69_14170 [Nitrospira bacterium SG8_3]|nr:MAG: hypothetical protein AMK69_14170 [Nitrospira bacterium SG8_3]
MSVVLKVMESLTVRITENLMILQKKFEGPRISTIILGKSLQLVVIKAWFLRFMHANRTRP